MQTSGRLAEIGLLIIIGSTTTSILISITLETPEFATERTFNEIVYIFNSNLKSFLFIFQHYSVHEIDTVVTVTCGNYNLSISYYCSKIQNLFC